MSHLQKLIFCRMHGSLVMGGLETVRQNSKDMRLLTARVPCSVRPAQTPASGCQQWPKAWVSGRPGMQEAAHSPSSHGKDMPQGHHPSQI